MNKRIARKIVKNTDKYSASQKLIAEKIFYRLGLTAADRTPSSRFAAHNRQLASAAITCIASARLISPLLKIFKVKYD